MSSISRLFFVRLRLFLSLLFSPLFDFKNMRPPRAGARLNKETLA
jgi:hypothetical protein